MRFANDRSLLSRFIWREMIIAIDLSMFRFDRSSIWIQVMVFFLFLSCLFSWIEVDHIRGPQFIEEIIGKNKEEEEEKNNRKTIMCRLSTITLHFIFVVK